MQHSKQPQSAIVQQGRKVFQRAVEGIRVEAKSEIDSLTSLDNEQLLVTYYVLHFWCVDAVLRLIKLQPTDECIDWVQYISASVRRFDLSLLVKVGLRSRDSSSTIDLLKIWVYREIYRDEIFRRLDQFKFSRAFHKYLRKRNSVVELAGLFDVTRAQIKAWIKRNAKPTESKLYLLRALNLKTRRSHRYESAAKILGQAMPDVQDTRSDSLLVIHEHYESRKSELAVELHAVKVNQARVFGEPAWIIDGDMLYVSPSPIIERYSEGSFWDEILHDALLGDIRERVNAALPLLDGSMEEAPLKIHDYHHTKARRLSKEPELVSYDDLHDRESKGDRDDPFPLSKIEWRYLHEYGFMDKPEILDVVNAQKQFTALLQTKLEKVNPPRKRAQIRDAIGLVLLSDQSAISAANKTKLSHKTVLKYMQELGLSDSCGILSHPKH